ncbi:helix-turn-helix domain-containing protein [Nocardia sp. NPDC005978]|uniref:helix-turn-helix domain-containing protein n=1 Tax=Nocardia sp. NPDC005978 TaxID=3156725 RepID=UPI0033AAD12F
MPDGGARKQGADGGSANVVEVAPVKAAPAQHAKAAAPAAKADAAAKPAAAKPEAAAKKVASEPAAAKPAAGAGGEPDLKALSDRIKARRKEMGWTQADLARTSGLSANAVSQLERCLNEDPAADVLAKLDTGLEWPSDTSDSILRGTELARA